MHLLNVLSRGGGPKAAPRNIFDHSKVKTSFCCSWRWNEWINITLADFLLLFKDTSYFICIQNIMPSKQKGMECGLCWTQFLFPNLLMRYFNLKSWSLKGALTFSCTCCLLQCIWKCKPEILTIQHANFEHFYFLRFKRKPF